MRPLEPDIFRFRACAIADLLVGCNNAGEGALSGAALGALGGLAIGSLSGDAGTGAAIGAVAGGVGGAVIGDQNERSDRRSRQRYDY
ncbi:MAG: glycine zipper domain-containing protein [Planctomycetota bacterium]